jgi:hypothetical protein
MTKLEKILIGVIVVIVWVSWFLYYKKAETAQNYLTAGAEISKMFYNAKDANLCLLWVISDVVSYDRCQSYIDKLIEDYWYLNEFLWADYSNYFPE